MSSAAAPRSVLSALVLLLGMPALALEPPAWPDKLVNPKPAADDLVLPMPCGGAMAFRRISVPSDGWLGDRRIVLGGTDERFRFAENSRYAYLAGGFTDPANQARRFYYLGKYEVTELQRASLGEACPEPATSGRLPAVGVSWFDAVAFAHAYTLWLHAHAQDQVPAEDGVSGFLRLPTEVEWEYAARGGSIVAEAAFQEPVFPMPDGLSRHAWFQGTGSANGQLQLAGLLAPDPLGLHDMLGNADEIVFEPFQLNKLSRLHGQAGGFIVKGGNYLTSAADLRASYRQEIAHFAATGPNRVRTIGMRLALAAPVITSGERLEAIRAAWAALPSSAAVSDRAEPLADPRAGLAQLIEGTPDAALRARLEGLRGAIEASAASANEQRARAARSTLRLGAFLARKIKDDVARVEAIERILQGRAAAGSSEEAIARVRQSLAQNEAALQENFQYYADTVIEAAQEYPGELIGHQLASLAVELQGAGLRDLADLAARFRDHIDRFRRDGRVERGPWLQELTAG